MRKLALLALCLPLVACVVGSDPGGGDGDGDGGGGGGGSGSANGLSGHITANTEWSGTVKLNGKTSDGGAVTIDPGVTVTVAAGTVINFAPASRLDIKGTLDVNGSAAAKVTLQTEPGAGVNHGGLHVYGTLTMDYAVQTGGGIYTNAGATATITDSALSKVSGDFLVMNGGAVTASYSNFGSGPGDSTHCQLHFGGTGNTISITKSNINTAPYGLMFYSGTNAIFTANNWEAGPTPNKDVDTMPGVSGDFSNSYFAAGPPVAGTGATITANNLSATRLLDAGPRP
ncbi:MAG: hypothetical protein WKG01_32300 [Kofleriaceae bacterium]